MIQFYSGSLVLHAKQRVSEYEVPYFNDCAKSSGQHVLGRYNGHWMTQASDDMYDPTIYLPQRHKHMQLTCSNPAAARMIRHELESLDSRYDGARQLYKLQMLINTVRSAIAKPFTCVVNIEATSANGKPTPGSFYLLASEKPINMFLCFDTKEDSVRLTWSSIPIIQLIRDTDATRYIFFPFRKVVNRPVFLQSQALCAKWWAFTNSFKNSPLGTLRACNALENLLFKDPHIETI